VLGVELAENAGAFFCGGLETEFFLDCHLGFGGVAHVDERGVCGGKLRPRKELAKIFFVGSVELRVRGATSERGAFDDDFSFFAEAFLKFVNGASGDAECSTEAGHGLSLFETIQDLSPLGGGEDLLFLWGEGHGGRGGRGGIVIRERARGRGDY